MVAIFTGAGTGFERGSGNVVGAAGLLGSAAQGRGGDNLFFNAATGNLLISRQDEFLVGRGPDVGISRTYNSLGNMSDDNQDNWRHSYDRRLFGLTGTVNTAGSTVKRRSGDGSEITYAWDSGRAAYVTTDGAGAYDTLTFSGTAWTWTDGDSQIKETYETRVYGLTGTLNTTGSTVRRRADDGAEVEYTWSGAAYFSQDGHKLTYSGSTWTWTEAGTARTETYDTAIPDWRLMFQKDTSNNSLTFTYRDNKLSKVTTANGESTRFAWSSNNITEIAVYGDSGTLLLTRTRYVYDGLNRLTTVTVDKSPSDSSVADGKSYVTSYTYHTTGNGRQVATISQTDGSSVAFGYDTAGRVSSIAQTVANGVTRTTEISYLTEVVDNVTKKYTEVLTAGLKIRLDYDDNNFLTKVTAPAAAGGVAEQTVHFGYNANGDLISVTDAAGQPTNYTHDSNGNVISVEDRLDNLITRKYGDKNELLWETRTGVGQTPGDPALRSRFVYDDANRLVATISAEGRVTRFHYDSYGQLTSTQSVTADPPFNVGGLGLIDVVPWTQVRDWYEGLADKSQVMLTVREYDARGNLDWEKAYSAATTGGAASQSQGWSYTDYLYDQAGQLLSRSAAGLSTETYVYDGLGRTIASTDLGGATTTIVFHDAATTTTVTVAGGMTRTSVYNKAGELVSTSETPAPVLSENLRPDLTNTAHWNRNNLSAASSTQIAGQPAWLYTVQTSNQAAAIVSGSTSVRVGDTITFEITLKETGNLSNHNLGIYGSKTGWGAALDSRAEIISGPGTIAQQTGGLWGVSGLSTTSETRVRITRTFNAGETASSYVYVAAGAGAQAGDNLIISAPSMMRTVPGPATRYIYDAHGRLRSTVEQTGATPVNLAPDLSNSTQWDYHGGTRVAAGTLGGSAAYLYTVNTNGYPAATSSSTGVEAGEEISFEITLKGSGSQTTQVLGLLGNVSGWGAASQSSAEIISGPGTLTQYGGLWELAGVSTSTETRIRITRRFTIAETARAYFYVGDASSAAQAGDQVILAAPILTKTIENARHIIYDNAGRMTGQVDQTGAITEYRYDVNNRVIATTRYANKISLEHLRLVKNPNQDVAIGTIRPAGHTDDLWTWTNYDLEGRMTRATDGDGTTTTYVYDASGQLIRTVGYGDRLSQSDLTTLKGNPAAIVGLPAAHLNDAVTRAFYDKDGRAIGKLDAMGYLSEIVYDRAGRKVREIAYANPTGTTGNLRASGTFTQLRDSIATTASDRSTRYIYDGQGLLRYTVDSLGHVVGYVYSDGVTASGTTHGQVRQTTAYGVKISASATYTIAGVEAAIATALAGPGPVEPSRTSYAIYDAAGRLAYAIGAEGLVTAYTYNTLGQVSKAVAFATPNLPSSLPSKATMDSWAADNSANPDNRITRSFYNGLGDLVYVIDAEGYVSETRYDPLGRVHQTVRHDGAVVATDGWTTSSVAGADKGGDTVTATFGYDHLGRVETTADAANTVTRNVYSATGLLIETIAAENTLVEVTTAFIYDAMGRVKSRTDGFGTAAAMITAYKYDGVGNLEEVRVAAGTPDESVTAYTYDALGRVLSVTEGYGTLEAATIEYTYDAFGNAERIKDAEGNFTFNYFDELGRIVATRDPEHHVTKTSYTVFGEVASLTRRHNKATNAASASVDPAVVADSRDSITSFNYNKLGQVTVVTDAENYQTTTSYNAFGQVQSVTRAGATTSYTYDNLGRTEIVTDAGNIQTITTYTANGEIRSVTRAGATTSFEYDVLGGVTKSTDAEGWFETYSYDALGRRTSVTNKIGGVTEYTYDSRGRLIEEEIWVSGAYNGDTMLTSTTIVNKFEYDLRGNLRKSIEAWGAPEARTTTYTYDDLNRVVTKTGMAVAVTDVLNGMAATTATPTETYVYDKRGNVIETKLESIVGETRALVSRSLAFYDGLSRAVARINPLGAVVYYSYDMNGNLTSSRAHDTKVTLPTTPGGSFAEPENAPLRETVYSYDRINRLKATSVIVPFAGRWDGSNFVIERGPDNTPLTVETAKYDYDAHGNVIKMTDANGNSVFAWYDALGRKTAQIDQELYLTTWTHDANGNVLGEWRYANKVTGAFTEATAASTLPVLLGAGAADLTRITTFLYDLNGRRTAEVRYDVRSSMIAADGVVTETFPTAAVIYYAYNGLGQVTIKQEANNDTTNYTYDNAGRLIVEKRAGYTDHEGNFVNPTVRYYYDGLDQLTSTRQGAFATHAGDRITTNNYAAGRLVSTTDAALKTRFYHYDIAGRVVAERYVRTLSNGSTVEEAVISAYDVGGQVVTQSFMRKADGSWVNTYAPNQAYVSTHMRYNAHGELTDRGLAAGLTEPTSYQEFFNYDAAGRMWRTNAGDGVVKFMVYDKAGNQTLSLTSTGGDLSALTVANYTASIDGIGDTTLAGAVTSINVYDKRGMVVETREPDRELKISTPPETVTIIRKRAYNAFGEVVSETDARGSTTTFVYNSMGRLTRTERPTVSITLANGTAIWVRPSDDYYYDISGRLIGNSDANGTYAVDGTATNGAIKAAGTGNLTTRLLLAGTGHGGSEALTAVEYHADSGKLRTFYDRFGDTRIVRNELGSGDASTTVNTATDEQRSYDKLGRLIQVIRRGGTLKEFYQLDEIGQRTRHWIEEIGTATIGHANIAAYVEKTDYDTQGRVTSTVVPGGDTTTITYAWDAYLSTNGLGTFGGWVKTTNYLAIGKSMVEKTDMFGHAAGGTGMDGTVTTMSYDMGARLVATSTNGGAASTVYTWLNTGLVSTISAITGNPTNAATTPMQDFTRRVQTSTYDVNGNKLTEHTQDDWGAWHLDPWNYSVHYNSGDTITQNANATYDALNRMVSWGEAGNLTTAPAASITQAYDAVGNIRRITATYRTLDGQGVISSVAAPDAERWYLYDNMNRITLDEGVLSGDTIVRGATGSSFLYDAAGNRIQAIRSAERRGLVYDPGKYPEGGYVQVPYVGAVREDYTFDAGGRLLTVSIAEGGYVANEDGTITPGADPTSAGGPKGSFTYDALGRQTRQIDGGGGYVSYQRDVTYNAAGQVAVETVYSRQGTDTYNTVSTNHFTAWLNPSNRWDGFPAYGQIGPGTYMGGIVTRIENVVTKNGDASAPDYGIVHEFVWGAGGTVLKNTTNHNHAVGVTDTYYTHDAAGVLTEVWVQDSRSRSITFTNDVLGQVIFRKEADSQSGGDPHEASYRFAGREIGGVGNNGTVETDYQTSITNRATTPGNGAFRGGSTSAKDWADFGRQIQPFTSFAQGEAGGVYTVRDGDSLHSIAAALWGDSALWYHLAEANGLSAGSALVPGQTLTLPAGIQRSSNSASTFKPYDPAAAIGDVSPGSPTPKKNKCGVIGAILIAIVAVAVTAILKAPVAKLFSALGKALGGALGGGALATKIGAVAGTVMGKAALAAVGNIAGQGFGIVTGLQQGGFNWNAVGTSALFAALPGFNVGNVAGSKFVGDVISGALSNAAGQATARLVGLQDKFDWAGVAAAGVGAGVAKAVGGMFKPTEIRWEMRGQTIATGMARSIASAATRSIATGTSFGDNIIATLPDVIGQTVGEMLADGMVGLARAVGGTKGGQATSKSKAEGSSSTTVAPARDGGATTGAAELPPISLYVPGRLEQYAYERSKAERVLRAQATAELGEGEEVVVTAPAGPRPASETNRAPLPAVGSVPAMGTNGYLWAPYFQDYGHNHADIAKQLALGNHVKTPAHAKILANQIISRTDAWKIRRFVLPSIEGAATFDERFEDVAAPLRSHLNAIDQRAIEGFDDQALIYLGSVAGSAGVLAGGVLAFPTVFETGQAFLYSNALRISTATGLAGEVVTGVQVGYYAPMAVAATATLRAAEGNILRQAGGVGGSAFPRTPGLGTHATMAELRASGAIPGVEGVILTDRTVRYADVYGLATQGGRRVEFSLVSETIDGARVRKLYSGDAWSSPVPRDARLIGHAHPNPGATQMWASPADMEIANARYFRSLQANPNAKPLPNHIFWGSGPRDVTTYYGGFGKW